VTVGTRDPDPARRVALIRCSFETSGDAMGWQELVIILAVLLLFFGAKKLPDLAGSLGSSIKEFRKATDDPDGDTSQDGQADTSPQGSADADRDTER
jgi:sec-independent protein translocase protein TatA